MKKKVIFIPGNGGGSPKDNWFPSVKKTLESVGLTVIAEEFPDNDFGGDYDKTEFPELSQAIIRQLIHNKDDRFL